MKVLENDTLVLKKLLMDSYDKQLDKDGVSGERVAARLEEIAAIGLTEEGGSNRPGFSKEEQKAKELAMKWMTEAGLNVWQDGAGNVFGRLEGKDNTLPAVMSGSHLDTVPNGGHFDGVLGVLAALETAESWKAVGFQPERSYEMVIFTDEEGATFNSSFTGSEAAVGIADIEEKQKMTDADGRSFEEVLENIGLDLDRYKQAVHHFEDVALFAEVHIEQGKVLEKEDLPCGIVTGIAGPCWLEVTFHGKAGHAGNTPMNDRQDALLAASEFIVKVNQIPAKISETAVATSGKQFVQPNGINVIPGQVQTYVDVRDIHQDKRDQIIDEIKQEAQRIGTAKDVRCEIKELANVAPVLMKEKYVHTFKKMMQKHGIRAHALPSGAGHDAMIVNQKTDAAMLFTRSKDGISHNPAEWSDLNDCIQTIHVLKSFIETV